MKVCIDPGHGGRDPGAVFNDVREADLVLTYSRALSAELLQRGHVVQLTRSGDHDLAPGLAAWKATDLSRRYRKANTMGADVLVSMHANASDNTAVSGAWILYAAGSARGEAVARAIFRELRGIPGATRAAEAVYPDESGWVGNRRLAVLHGSKMPAVLIEMGFLTNLDDVTRLQRPGMPERFARAIADGLERWHVGKVTARPRPTLRRGDRSAAVGELQVALDVAARGDAGFEHFGPRTEQAVRLLQAGAGLTVDGVVGPATWRALGL